MDATETPTPAVDHLGLEVLRPEECWELIAGVPVGRVAFVEDGSPMVLPVVHVVSGRRIGFRSPAGGKLAAARMGRSVAFEVDAWDAGARTGWSVVARGTAESAPDDVGALAADAPEPWLPTLSTATWVEIRVDEISGRRLGPR